MPLLHLCDLSVLSFSQQCIWVTFRCDWYSGKHVDIFFHSFIYSFYFCFWRPDSIDILSQSDLILCCCVSHLDPLWIHFLALFVPEHLRLGVACGLTHERHDSAGHTDLIRGNLSEPRSHCNTNTSVLLTSRSELLLHFPGFVLNLQPLWDQKHSCLHRWRA